jgi:two-component system response regulator VicR
LVTSKVIQNSWVYLFYPPVNQIELITAQLLSVKKKILVIEDDEDILELLKIVFRDSGYDMIFSNIDLDTDYISVLHPDLVLLDVRIKGASRDGAQICREIKSSPLLKELPVILCSAEYNLAEIAQECEADMYISKPYDFLGLLSQVNRFLS